jgi:amidase
MAIAGELREDRPMTDVTGLPATRLAEAIAARELSSQEVVEAHLRRIEAVNPRVNAVVQVDGDRALAAAREADATSAAPGPLHGVPFTVKDNLEAVEIEMAIGAEERVGTIPGSDATVVARMRAAGAILLGKTNCPEYGGGIETDNAVYGRTNNPYDLDRTPGGSSGGEAAAIAAGCSPCGLGTDSGASVRLPAHFCGLAALKPTSGRVPVTGVIDDLGQIGALGDPRTQVGILARSVRDVALILELVSGPDGADGGVPPVPLPGAKPGSLLPSGGMAPDAADLPALRVAVQTDNGLDTPTPETVAAIEAAAQALAAAGALVEPASPPGGGHELTIDVWRSYGDASDLYDILRRWDAYRSQMLAWFAAYDLILCPVFPDPARVHGDMNRPGERDPTSYTTPYSLTGWPAATVSCGTSPEGLPIGVQLVARPWRDDHALAAAYELERAGGGWRPPPNVNPWH